MKQVIDTQAWIISPESETRSSLLGLEPGVMVGRLCLYNADMTPSGWVKFADATLALDILPGETTDAAQIAALEEQIKKATEKFNHEKERIEQLINSLKRLPNFVNEQ